MALSNLKHRHHFLERRSATKQVITLTPVQMADRVVVAFEPLWPVPSTTNLPRFQGGVCYEWSEAPEALADMVGLLDAWLGWLAERDKMDAACAALGQVLQQSSAREQPVYIEDDMVTEGLRPLNEQAVERLCQGIRATNGLRSPVVVRFEENEDGD